MNRKGGLIGFVLLIFVFLIIWFVWLGSWIATAGQIAVTEGGLTGIEAFFYSNLNLVVFIGLILGIMGYFYWTGGG